MEVPDSIVCVEVLWFPRSHDDILEKHICQKHSSKENDKSCSPKKKDKYHLSKEKSFEKEEKNSSANNCNICKLKRHLSEVLGINIDFKKIELKNSSKIKDNENTKYSYSKLRDSIADHYDHLCSIACDLRLERDFSMCCINLIKNYCTLPKEIVQDTWLKLDLKKVILDDAMRSSDSNLCIQNFSLGNLVGLNTFVEHFNSQRFPEEAPDYKISQIKCKFLNDQNRFELYFLLGQKNVLPHRKNHKTHKLFKLEFSYSHFHRLLISHTGKFVVYFQYLTSPLLYKVSEDDDANDDDATSNHYTSYFEVTPQTYWQRSIDLYENCTNQDLKLQFVKNNVIRLEFTKSQYNCLSQLLKFHKNIEVFFSPMQIVKASPKACISGLDLKYLHDSMYAVKCLTSISYEFVDHLVVRNELKDMNKFLQTKSQENSKLLAKILYRIYDFIEKGAIVAFYPTIRDMYDKNKDHENIKDKKTPSNENKKTIIVDESKLKYIKKVYLFPTHIRFCPPQKQLTNRLLKYAKPEFFMRVTIRDVDFQSLNHTARGFGKGQKDFQENFFKEYVKKRLLKGIKLGNLRYSFLGCSTSQLKSQSMWFFSVDPDNKNMSVAEIMKKIGNLDEINEVPKYMARLGQSFSQAIGRIKVEQECTNVDNPDSDVEGDQKIYLIDSDEEEEKRKKKKPKHLRQVRHSFNRNDPNSEDDDDDDQPDELDPYIFSDGIGRMSDVIAKEIYEQLELQEDSPPSAVQIRYAGCKGMLVIDPTLKGRKIRFRKSMKKYNSKGEDSLEILSYSKPRNVFLNRHLIAILEQKGIKKEIFLSIQQEMIKTLIYSLFYEDYTCELLRSNTHLLKLSYDKMYDVGFHFTEDPFFRSIMLSIFKMQLQLLKDKARIKLPDNCARNMFGVLDETHTLEYGQVFVQYTKWNTNQTEICKGTIVVTKNPCMHPGDVRKFEAVDVVELRHIRDCIVFPAKGGRPHPDEMAGSDLDGDEYVVIFYDDLIFYDQPNSPAMDYAVKKKKEKIKKVKQDKQENKPVDVEEQLDHFCNYVLNDHVGILANAYLAWADEQGMILPDGKINKKCLSIAKKHAKALDFAKSGVPAVMKQDLRKQTYPDYLGKKDGKQTYVSQKALGYLYRACKNLELGLHATADQMEYRPDEDLNYDGWKKYEISAQEVLKNYVEMVDICLKKYGFKDEGEMIAGNFPQSKKLYSTTSEFYTALQMLEFEVSFMFSELEKRFFEEFGGKPKDGNFTEDMLCKASAWYMVCYSKDNVSQKFFGLPWSISEVLMAIKARKAETISASNNLMIKNSSCIEKAIDEHIAKDLPPLEEWKDSVYDYKMSLIDTSHDILKKWLEFAEFTEQDNKEKAEELLERYFESVTEKLLTCDDNYIIKMLQSSERKKVISCGHYVLETLLLIAGSGTGIDHSVSAAEHHQEIGLIAWITLVKLACSVNPQYLGLNTEGQQFLSQTFRATHEDVIDTINYSLEIKNNDSEETKQNKRKLLIIYINAEESFKNFLISKYKISEISMRIEESRRKPKLSIEKQQKADKKQDSEEADKQEYLLRMTFRGSRFLVERLKDFVFSKSFLHEVTHSKSIRKDLDLSKKKDEELFEWGRSGSLLPEFSKTLK